MGPTAGQAARASLEVTSKAAVTAEVTTAKATVAGTAAAATQTGKDAQTPGLTGPQKAGRAATGFAAAFAGTVVGGKVQGAIERSGVPAVVGGIVAPRAADLTSRSVTELGKRV